MIVNTFAGTFQCHDERSHGHSFTAHSDFDDFFLVNIVYLFVTELLITITKGAVVVLHVDDIGFSTHITKTAKSDIV